ncbi:hypothetical protein OG21DRAFT_168060 [Imleria badia]|nr:hypothetical protein OG21DRAFT_168060 [Imleria badia]
MRSPTQWWVIVLFILVKKLLGIGTSIAHGCSGFDVFGKRRSGRHETPLQTAVWTCCHDPPLGPITTSACYDLGSVESGREHTQESEWILPRKEVHVDKFHPKLGQ